MGKTQKSTLIDFLYRDYSRIDSLVSQLFQGNLKEIAATSACANKQTNNVEGSIPGIAKGGYGGEEILTETLAKKIDPLDQKIIDLLGGFDIAETCLNDVELGRIVLLKGCMKLRDYAALKSTMPVMSQFASMTNYFGQTKREFEKLYKLITVMIDIVPIGLELEPNINW